MFCLPASPHFHPWTGRGESARGVLTVVTARFSMSEDSWLDAGAGGLAFSDRIAVVGMLTIACLR